MHEQGTADAAATLSYDSGRNRWKRRTLPAATNYLELQSRTSVQQWPQKKNWALLPELKINQRAFATFDRGFCSILGCKYWPTLINEVTRGIKWVKTDIN